MLQGLGPVFVAAVDLETAADVPAAAAAAAAYALGVFIAAAVADWSHSWVLSEVTHVLFMAAVVAVAAVVLVVAVVVLVEVGQEGLRVHGDAATTLTRRAVCPSSDT